jgi:hypothetical protein
MSNFVTSTKKILKGKNQQLGLAWIYLSLIGLVIIVLIDIGAQNGPTGLTNDTKKSPVTKKNQGTVFSNFSETNIKSDSDTDSDSKVKDEGGFDLHHEFIWSKDKVKKEKPKVKQPTLVNNIE